MKDSKDEKSELKATLFLWLSVLFFTIAVSVWPFSGKHFASQTASLCFFVLSVLSIALSIKAAGWRS